MCHHSTNQNNASLRFLVSKQKVRNGHREVNENDRRRRGTGRSDQVTGVEIWWYGSANNNRPTRCFIVHYIFETHCAQATQSRVDLCVVLVCFFLSFWVTCYIIRRPFVDIFFLRSVSSLNTEYLRSSMNSMWSLSLFLFPRMTFWNFSVCSFVKSMTYVGVRCT